MNVKLLVWVNGIMGVILASAGSITAYATAVGQATGDVKIVTVVGLVLGGIGVLQTIAAGVIHVFDPTAGAKVPH
jgi:hypothetical protein